ncbi:MAG: N-acetylneuraminate synthase family protein [Candidatus Omnitrophica bacterium]|nr:N-acetylneuraminate synthase family protein [Candidatus Omnitrophota bacterium]
MFKFNSRIKLGEHIVSREAAALLIAEIGVNHNGKMEIAKEMIKEAAKAGADIVKFQTFNADEFMADKDVKYAYKSGGKTIKEGMYSMFKRLELPVSWHIKLKEYCLRNKVQFLSTPCDRSAVDLLMKVGVSAFKISSEDLINIDLLEYVAGKNKPVILSTGMAKSDEIDHALNIFKRKGNKNLILMHCTSVYPTPEREVNLKRMVEISRRYDILSGFSDHSKGDLAAIAAVSMGAVIVEKHFTLGHQMKGPDHIFSSTPSEYKSMVDKIRLIERMKGKGGLGISPTEEKLRMLYRRSIVAGEDLEAGSRIELKNLAYKRPGDGLRPMERYKLIGKKLKRNLKKNEKILINDLSG